MILLVKYGELRNQADRRQVKRDTYRSMNEQLEPQHDSLFKKYNEAIKGILLQVQMYLN